MSKIIGLAILTSPRPVDSNKFVYFDANFWLGDGMQALACLWYFNKSCTDFDVDEAIPCFVQASIALMNSDANIEAPDMVEEDKKEYHIVGDIIQMIPAVIGNITDNTKLESLCQPPQISVGGVVKRSNRTSDTEANTARFDVDCSRHWVNAFWHNLGLSKSPVHTFISKNQQFQDPKKACPSKDTWVAVSGRLSRVEVDESTGWSLQLILDVGADGNIAFMGKWTPPFTPLKTPNGNMIPAKGTKRKFNFDSFTERGSPVPRKRGRTEKENTPNMSS
ncbi:hypothetical protein BDN71DRAFT_1505292 [Pleurotus eryngii]|uniref:Uncharacterized protein n=1 Tax=Pleurotus eryngii TaxID=5323 RepID=A0A9P6A0Y6_PLEER|nr:hypothetical protein BDN71DRAFT_1505292 [Pleurotus eryngii]